ncbi:MAG: hypothetical protein AAGU32_03200 [Bacillota bacterium]
MPDRQLFAELAALQRDIERGLAVQEQFIRRFQALIQSEKNAFPLLNLFPCPVAIFGRDGVLHRVNNVLTESTDLGEGDVPDGNISFLGRITNENYAILEAAEGVFYGKTALLSRLSYLLELFCKSWNYPVGDDYHSALIFPLPDREGCITYGVVMLLK